MLDTNSGSPCSYRIGGFQCNQRSCSRDSIAFVPLLCHLILFFVHKLFEVMQLTMVAVAFSLNAQKSKRKNGTNDSYSSSHEKRGCIVSKLVRYKAWVIKTKRASGHRCSNHDWAARLNGFIFCSCVQCSSCWTKCWRRLNRSLNIVKG